MIQIDIPMPKNCGECPICNEYLMCGIPCNGRGWGENDVSDYFTSGRPEWCPLKEQEVVRCKDCKYRFVDGDNVRFNMCLLNHNKVQPDDWFCADGVAKDINVPNKEGR